MKIRASVSWLLAFAALFGLASWVVEVPDAVTNTTEPLAQIFVGLMLLVVFVLAVGQDDTASCEIPREVEVRVVYKDRVVRAGILVDPTIDDLKEYSALNNGINPIPFWLTLTREGKRYRCLVKLIENADPQIVEVEGVPCRLGWHKHAARVAKFVEQRNIVVNH